MATISITFTADASGLADLNTFLESRSYIVGCVQSVEGCVSHVVGRRRSRSGLCQAAAGGGPWLPGRQAARARGFGW
jgi:hypothetical protein